MKKSLVLPVPRWKVCRILFTSMLLVLVCSGLEAQYANRAPAVDTANMSVEQKLVRLALDGPAYKVSEHKNKLDELQLRKAKAAWLNLLSLSLNYNDQSISKTTQTAFVYPKYFFGVTIPLGIMFSNGIEIKTAREALKASHTTQDQVARQIKRDILSKYAEYKTYGELLSIQNKVVDDEEAAFRKAEKNFGDGTTGIEVYTAASKNYNNELTKRINLKLQQDLKELEIEEMIGVELETVIGNASVN